jgi:PAS domain S-box-containing protein
MLQAPVPQNEAERLAALQATELLDTASEARFDRLTRLVQQCLDAEIVLISLVDKDRQWFKSRQGLDACETGRNISFCGHAIIDDNIFEISDAAADVRFADNPLVTDAPFIRFYAGAPLIFAGQRIGTLCIISSTPRQLTAKEKLILREFAGAVEQEIKDRQQEHAKQELAVSREQFQRLVANIPGITYRCKADSDWTMLYMSGGIDPLSGYPATDFIDNKVRSYASVIHSDDRERLEQVVAEAIALKQSWILQYRIIHKLGHICWVEERGKAEFDENGQLSFLDGLILDISEEKRLKRQLITLTSQLPGVVYQYQQRPDGTGAFPYASAALQSIYGVTPEQVKADASAVFAKIYPADLPALTDSIEQSRLQLAIWQNEYRIYREDGSLAWLAGRAVPERMPDGGTLWHGYIQDITETKQYYLQLEQVNRELKLARQRLDTASENALIGFWQATLESGELWWSPVIYQIFGFDEATTTPSVALFKSTLHPDDKHLVELSEKTAQTTGVHDVVHRIIRPDGTIRWVHELARMVPASDNPEKILIGSVQDVTERMQLQQLKNEFISTVSHELRTPLTSIKGALGLLNSGKLGSLPDTMQKLIKVAHSNSERLSQLIDDLLDIEKLVAGKMPFDLCAVDVGAELEQVVRNLQPYANHYAVELQIDEIPAELHIKADKLRLQQVLTNLLSNAIKFSDKNSTVMLKASRQSDCGSIEIHDSGIGIAPEFQPRLFERFAQADGSSSRQSGGTGLGLAICKELVEQMGGSIGFTSVLHQGTVFCFSLPLHSGTTSAQATGSQHNEDPK